MSKDLRLRKAAMADVKGIHQLLLKTAAEGLLLPRPLGDLYKCVREFYVLDREDSQEVLGCCALSIVWDDIAEIRSLVVDDSLRGSGYGARLVRSCLDEAIALGLSRVFTLTYQDGFFAKQGFATVKKEVLPNKIWADCIHCPKFPDCDEIAMLLELQ
ncbi:N-acetyltransferase [Desulfovibrio sp. OttesenSCG-928-C06]|nr:N-acetyltransferase [Desulfovibrio sp. OttesenSCG-928-C06]